MSSFRKISHVWLEKEVFLLLDLYHGFPILWNVHSTDYKKRNVRMVFLRKIHYRLINKISLPFSILFFFLYVHCIPIRCFEFPKIHSISRYKKNICKSILSIYSKKHIYYIYLTNFLFTDYIHIYSSSS